MAVLMKEGSSMFLFIVFSSEKNGESGIRKMLFSM